MLAQPEIQEYLRAVATDARVIGKIRFGADRARLIVVAGSSASRPPSRSDRRQDRSNRSSCITFANAAAKSRTNLSAESLHP